MTRRDRRVRTRGALQLEFRRGLPQHGVLSFSTRKYAPAICFRTIAAEIQVDERMRRTDSEAISMTTAHRHNDPPVPMEGCPKKHNDVEPSSGAELECGDLE